MTKINAVTMGIPDYSSVVLMIHDHNGIIVITVIVQAKGEIISLIHTAQYLRLQ